MSDGTRRDEPLSIVRGALAGVDAWLVGGALRDRILGRPVDDVDVVVDGDPAAAARTLARAAGGPAFELSEDFGAWRVLARDRSWQADVSALRGGSLAADLVLRDFTINAMAESLAGGALIDPHGGEADLAAGRLRMTSSDSFSDDPLRVVRAARFACELTMTIAPATVAAARAEAPRARTVAQERVFAELRRIVGAPGPLRGIELLDDVGALGAVLPELVALRGVEQSRYHHRDAYGHTLEVLERAVELQRDPAAIVGAADGARVVALLDEPLADELTRGQALRWAALLHDSAKSRTQAPLPEGGYGFPHHDREGAELARTVLGRLRTSERLRSHVAAMTLHHLRPGMLVHRQPLSERDFYGYLTAAEPVEVDVVLLSVADRLATRGRKAERSIANHMAVVGELLPRALDWRDGGGAPAPLLRGDDLAKELGLTPGPEIGRLLAAMREAQYTGEVATREQALELARRL